MRRFLRALKSSYFAFGRGWRGQTPLALCPWGHLGAYTEVAPDYVDLVDGSIQDVVNCCRRQAEISGVPRPALVVAWHGTKGAS